MQTQIITLKPTLSGKAQTISTPPILKVISVTPAAPNGAKIKLAVDDDQENVPCDWYLVPTGQKIPLCGHAGSAGNLDAFSTCLG